MYQLSIAVSQMTLNLAAFANKKSVIPRLLQVSNMGVTSLTGSISECIIKVYLSDFIGLLNRNGFTSKLISVVATRKIHFFIMWAS